MQRPHAGVVLVRILRRSLRCSGSLISTKAFLSERTTLLHDIRVRSSVEQQFHELPVPIGAYQRHRRHPVPVPGVRVASCVRDEFRSDQVILTCGPVQPVSGRRFARLWCDPSRPLKAFQVNQFRTKQEHLRRPLID